METEDLTHLPLLPREGGKAWPEGRSWTADELLELRELQLREALWAARYLWEYWDEDAEGARERCAWIFEKNTERPG